MDARRLISLMLAALLAGHVLADDASDGAQAPDESRHQVDLEKELSSPFQAGGEIVVFAAADGTPRAGRRIGPPAEAAGERARRAEHFALARKLNLVTQPRVVPFALPLDAERIELLERFAFSDAGAVWFREVADDTLRLFNRGYLDMDPGVWRTFLDGGARPRLSELITGRLSEAGLFAQDAVVFRFYAFDGFGAMAGGASIRLGLRGFRCNFSLSGELVDPQAIISHEFGHTRYGDPRSAGLPLGEALTVARYENPVRRRNGFPPRSIYYLRVEPGRAPTTRDALFNRLLGWRQEKDLRLEDLKPVQKLYCECPDAPGGLRDCLAEPSRETPAECGLRWVAVRVGGEDAGEPE
jgi:hypothetical protein